MDFEELARDFVKLPMFDKGEEGKRWWYLRGNGREYLSAEVVLGMRIEFWDDRKGNAVGHLSVVMLNLMKAISSAFPAIRHLTIAKGNKDNTHTSLLVSRFASFLSDRRLGSDAQQTPPIPLDEPKPGPAFFPNLTIFKIAWSPQDWNAQEAKERILRLACRCVSECPNLQIIEVGGFGLGRWCEEGRWRDWSNYTVSN